MAPVKDASRSHLLEFYGIECDHCVDMEPLMERLQKETGLPIRRFEVWYSDDNLRLLQKLDKGSSCGGVPFFYNKKTKGWICGATTYENLKSWALGRPHQRFLPPPKDTKDGNKIMQFFERIQKQAMEKMQQRMNEQQQSGPGKGALEDKSGRGRRAAQKAKDTSNSKGKPSVKELQGREATTTSLQERGKK
jgi:thiol-disulfide isomerase/thioredoxin